MAVSITPEIEQMVESLYQSGGFTDRTHVLDEALRLLQRRKEVARQIQEGIDDLESGEFTDYDESSLDRFRSDVGMSASGSTVSE